MSELFDHPILITGASSGIGFQLARKLSDAGAKQLIITGRDAKKLSDAAVALSNSGEAQVMAATMDQACKDSISEVVDVLTASGSKPLTLVCNVGVNPVHLEGASKVHATDYQQFAETLTTNVLNGFFLIQHYLPAMREAKFGRIILIGSQAYRYGIPGQVSYNVSKSALVGLKNSLNSEYQSKNIYCGLMDIGMIANERTARIRRRIQRRDDALSPTPLTEADAAQKIWSAMQTLGIGPSEVDIE